MIYRLDSLFKPRGILTNFESLIWHEKYYECGNFEFHAPYSLKDTAYIYDNELNLVGIVESVNQKEMQYVYKGHLVKGLLFNKVIPYTCTYRNVSAEYIVKDLIKKFNLYQPHIEIEPSQNRGKTYDMLQVTGKNLLEYTDNLLKESELGAVIDYDFINNRLVYKVIKGTDNTSKKMPLCKNFNNIYSFTYTEDKGNFKNFAYVAGEKSNKERVIVTVDLTTGYEKKEIYVDARDLQSTYTDENGNQVTMSDFQYQQALKQRGLLKLNEYQMRENIEVEPKENLEIGEKRLFKDGKMVATHRVTEKITAYEENRVKKTIVLGLKKIDRIDRLKREVKE